MQWVADKHTPLSSVILIFLFIFHSTHLPAKFWADYLQSPP
jgi:hypothetical protein